MIGRLGFVGRLSAILMLALIALWVLAASVSYVTHAPLVPVPGTPLPNQVAAIVELLETSDAGRRTTILSAASSDTLLVSLSEKAPQVAPGNRRLKAIEWLVRQYVGNLGSREVIATLDPADLRSMEHLRAGGRYLQLIRRPLHLAVALNGGGFVIFETKGEISRRLFGLPVGFWVGALGSLVGIAALLAVWREARPLKDLSVAVSRFSGDGQPIVVPPRGAPELRRLIGEVNRMQERIATLLKGRTVLLGAVSHDLKTYITRLKLRAEAITDPDQQARAVHDLDDMTVLIENALAVARGSSALSRTSTVDLGDILRSICADQPGIDLDLPATPMSLEGDAVGLRRVFVNLTDNALRYGGKKRSVRAFAKRGALSVTIDDNGPGIPASERSLVFEPFYRREPSRSRDTGGSGLGLAIAKQIVELHGGSIELGDAPAGGLRVTVELPSAT